MDIRNIAIIAHVDHGKTTLVDELLKQSGAFRANQNVSERVMDSNDLERERGITILAKATSVEWKETRINIVDTPGHADFGGEVERILNMVDGVVLLVDAAEGPMPQTKFVTSKALKLGLRPIVVLNKVDKSDAEPDRALDECFDLFASLDANEDQLDFPHMYASGRSGWADHELSGPRKDLSALFDLIINHVPVPEQISRKNEDFKMLATTLGHDPFVGRILTGRIESGQIKVGATVQALSRIGQKIEQFRITKILAFRGLSMNDIDEATAGDIVSLAGMNKSTVSDTLCALAVEEPIEALPIDPPTISVTFGINDSPLAGREGNKVQSRVIRERLFKEAESNVAIKVTETPSGDAFEVAGRGELQMGVLIENMRREGFELSISRPQVLIRKDENGKITFEEFSDKHQKIFNNMDKDSDGFISRDEIDRKREGKNNISRYADRLDLNNDLKIDKNEFIRGQSNRFKRDQKASKNRRHIDSKQRRHVAEKIFESADADNNGSLNTSELSKVRELAPKVAKNHRFSQVDLDKNNKLTQEEFLAPIKKKFSN